MRARRGNVLLGIVGMMVWGLATPVVAEEGSSTYGERVGRKLGRGAANVLTFPLELIRTPELVGRRDGYVSGSTVGLAQGVWHAVWRGVVGLTEVVTFLIPLPDKNFGPLLRPEFVWAHGNWAE